MKIVVEGIVPEGCSVSISCCSHTKIIDTMEKSAIFDVPQADDLIVTFEQKKSTRNYSFINILIFLLTSVIQGIFNILLMNVDSKWYKNVRAYDIKAVIKITDKSKNIYIPFRLSESKYNGNDWDFPEFSVETNLNVKVKYEKNPQGIRNAYFTYTKKILSIFFVNVLIFAILLFISISHSLGIALWIMIGLITLVTLLTMWLIIKEKYRCEELINLFLNDSDKFSQ